MIVHIQQSQEKKTVSEIRLLPINMTAGEKFNGDKRTYMPYIVTWKCTKCGVENDWDISDNYLSYPDLGNPFVEELYCDCGHDEDTVTLKISLSLVDGENDE